MLEKCSINAALSETAIAFDPQLQMGGFFENERLVPAGIELLNNGKAMLRFYAPNARSVIVHTGFLEGEITELQKQSDGVWTAELGYNGDNYTTLFYEVDGVYVLNPMSPIGWSHSHPINIIDYPSQESDFYLLKDVEHGAVTRDYYYSETCGCYKSCLVYTPPRYMLGRGNNLPVLYLQHGYGENETSWVHLGKVNWIMDNLLAEGKAEPCVIVMNNGMVQTEKADGARTWNAMSIEKLLLSDCIPFIESHYRVSKDKWHRAMAGLSMGSMQTSITTLTNPDMFSYVGIFSGFLGKIGPETEADNPHFVLLSDKRKLFDAFKLFYRCIGETDSFSGQFYKESVMLQKKGLSPDEWQAHKEVSYKGGHDWNVWRPCVRDFLSLLFK